MVLGIFILNARMSYLNKWQENIMSGLNAHSKVTTD
jgi:hypothetical protein